MKRSGSYRIDSQGNRQLISPATRDLSERATDVPTEVVKRPVKANAKKAAKRKEQQ